MILIVPFEAFSIDSAQATAAACIGCCVGTQCEKRISTGLSCAIAGADTRPAAIAPVKHREFEFHFHSRLCLVVVI